MFHDAGSARAQALLGELYGHVADISDKLEAADERIRRARARGIARRDPVAGVLRRELYEAHRLIDGLHRRYPHTLAAWSGLTSGHRRHVHGDAVRPN